jgi:hypothetical protein
MDPVEATKLRRVLDLTHLHAVDDDAVTCDRSPRGLLEDRCGRG